jgi:hypothetical protein
MNKTPIILSAAFLLSIAACKSQDDEWTDGKEAGRYRDTVSNGQHYRHYGGLWYLVVGGMISPYRYRGASMYDISRPGFRPSYNAGYHPSGRRSGGFGSSGRSTYGG